MGKRGVDPDCLDGIAGGEEVIRAAGRRATRKRQTMAAMLQLAGEMSSEARVKARREIALADRLIAYATRALSSMREMTKDSPRVRLAAVRVHIEMLEALARSD